MMTSWSIGVCARMDEDRSAGQMTLKITMAAVLMDRAVWFVKYSTTTVAKLLLYSVHFRYRAPVLDRRLLVL